MTEDQIIRKIAVIFVTDVVNFSTLMEKMRILHYYFEDEIE